MGRSRGRLAVELALLGQGQVLADVGAGDLELSRMAVEGGRFARAIALERGGPLRRAQRLAANLPGVEVRASDGLSALAPGEAEAVVMGGFGGASMASLLARQRAALRGVRRLVVAPRGEVDQVRQVLAELGFWRTAERLVEEGPRLSWVLAAEPLGRPYPRPEPLELELGLAAGGAWVAPEPLLLRYVVARMGHLRRLADGGGGGRLTAAQAEERWQALSRWRAAREGGGSADGG